MSTQKWANIGEDAGALHALVDRVREHVAIGSIDYLWIFPARAVAAGESIVLVVGAFDEDPERRRVITIRYTVSRNKKGEASVNTRFDEHGSAPTAAVPRIVQGVLRRLGEDVEAEPREEQISGEEARWVELVADLGGGTAGSGSASEEAGIVEPGSGSGSEEAGSGSGEGGGSGSGSGGVASAG